MAEVLLGALEIVRSGELRCRLIHQGEEVEVSQPGEWRGCLGWNWTSRVT